MVSVILKPNKSLDLKQLYKHVVTYLPSYACPRFLRLQVYTSISIDTFSITNSKSTPWDLLNPHILKNN